MDAHHPNAALRWLEPFVSGVWILFLLWSAGVAAMWAFGFGEEQIKEIIHERNLQEVLVWLARSADLIWVVLAAVNVYAGVTAEEGLRAARRRALLAMGGGFAVSSCSFFTGFPLGALKYTSRLGSQLFHVPVGVLLLWVSVVLAARVAALWLAPRLSLAGTVLLSGLLAGLTDLNLEWGQWAAVRGRAWWLWQGGAFTSANASIPGLWQSPLVWMLVTSGLVWCCRDVGVKQAPQKSGRTALVLIAMNSAFLIGHLQP